MNFGFSAAAEGGDFLPLFTYSAKSGRFGVKETVEVGGEYQKQERELGESEVQFVADFGSIQQGWLLFKSGTAPIKAMVQISSPLPARPAGHGDRDAKTGKEIFPKEGFLLHVMMKDGVLREFASNARACITGVAEMMQAYGDAPEKAQDMLPVLRLARTYKADKNGNYAPQFEIVKWVPKPEAFNGASAPAPVAAPPPRPAPEPVQQAAPVAAVTADAPF